VSDEKTPTPGELEILKVLWELGPSTVRAVHEYIIKEPKPAFNTVQTILRIMADKKGLVDGQLAGRSFVYTARYSRDEIAVRILDTVFDGAAAEVVQSLIRAERVSGDELDQMQQLIDDARRRKAPRNGRGGGK